MRSALSRRTTISVVAEEDGVSSPCPSSHTHAWEYEDSSSIYSSTGSTIPGPGALSGKAIKTLGEATLRGMGHVRMLGHFLVVAHSFPLADNDANQLRNVDELYDDLLEFSRIDLYPGGVGEKALRIILAQIGMGQTRHLIRAISRWHISELMHLLSDILVQLSPLWNPSLYLGFLFACPLLDAYTTAYPSDYVSATPLILFVSKIIRMNTSFCEVALKVGFLDVLLSLCQTERLESPKTISSRSSCPEALSRKHLLIACNVALLDITAYQEYLPFVKSHPISSTWPEHSDGDSCPARRKPLFLDRNMDVSFYDGPSPYLRVSLADIFSNPHLEMVPALDLLQSLRVEVTYRQAARRFFMLNPLDEKIALLKKMVESVKSLLMSTTSGKNLEQLRSGSVAVEDFLFFLEFATQIAPKACDNKQALRDAGVVSLLTYALGKSIPDDYIAILFLRNPKKFSDIVRIHGLSEFVDERILSSLSIVLCVLFDEVG